MIDLSTICIKLESIKEKLEEKIKAIEDRAYEHDRDLTEREEERIEEMQGEVDAIEDALDHLRNYANDY